MSTAVRSHAKINLGLGIGAPRTDGFHGLATVYQTLELHDIVEVTATPATATSIELGSNDPRVPTDARNTAWKMVALTLEALGVTAAVKIEIHKRLPVQGGLGAGSANAVAALVGLEIELAKYIGENNEPGEFWNPTLAASTTARQGWGTRNLMENEAGLENLQNPNWPVRRLEIAAEVGSDVPLFLIGGAVLGVDRGQEVYPLPDFEPTWCVVAIPEVGVSTAKAFADWDALCEAGNLTAEASAAKLKRLSSASASAFAQCFAEMNSSGVLSSGGDLAGHKSALVRTGILSWILNDFEEVVFPQYPLLKAIKCLLAPAGKPDEALYAALSGSGSALFGLYTGPEKAKAAILRLRAEGVESYLTRTLPRSDYWQRMLVRNSD
jgi:4-diphosphocytidyl-2-C-methyl-D-erythritol kinase